MTRYPALKLPQRQRLAKLASYLEVLPKDYDHFSMSQYFSVAEPEELPMRREPGYLEERLMDYAQTGKLDDCGTVACALGHGPAAGIPIELTEGGFYRAWNRYAELFTGGDRFIWQWLFSGDWAKYDNTPHGAAARIRYVLADEAIPQWPEADDPDDEDEVFEEAIRENFDDWWLLYLPYRVPEAA